MLVSDVEKIRESDSAGSASNLRNQTLDLLRLGPSASQTPTEIRGNGIRLDVKRPFSTINRQRGGACHGENDSLCRTRDKCAQRVKAFDCDRCWFCIARGYIESSQGVRRVAGSEITHRHRRENGFDKGSTSFPESNFHKCRTGEPGNENRLP